MPWQGALLKLAADIFMPQGVPKPPWGSRTKPIRTISQSESWIRTNKQTNKISMPNMCAVIQSQGQLVYFFRRGGERADSSRGYNISQLVTNPRARIT